jgi:Domain of unknown function (DUF4279)
MQERGCSLNEQALREAAIADDVEPHVALRWMGMSAGNRVYFYTKSAEHQVEELVAMAGVEPTRTWEKGKHIRHHGFEVRPSFKETGDVEDKLRTIISLLLPYTGTLLFRESKGTTHYREGLW